MDEYSFYFKPASVRYKKIVSLDLEWAKNWKAEIKIVPFCFSCHIIHLPDENRTKGVDLNNFSMESHHLFKAQNENATEFLEKVVIIIDSQMDEKSVIVGHQLSSDLHCIIQNSATELPTIKNLIQSLQQRKTRKPESRIADTRYDIKGRILGKEKLRSVSLRYKIYAVQTELDKYSLTKLYNLYCIDGDITKKEMLLVMNWRHAFQTAAIWLIDQYCYGCDLCSPVYPGALTTNDILYRMGHNEISYLNSDEYLETLTFQGIEKYINKYKNELI